MCSLVAHYKQQPAYEYEESILGYMLVPKNATTEASEALGDAINFIDIWLKLLENNYEIISGIYNKSMKDTFKKITLTMIKALSTKKSPESYDRNWWWMVYEKKC